MAGWDNCYGEMDFSGPGGSLNNPIEFLSLLYTHIYWLFTVRKSIPRAVLFREMHPSMHNLHVICKSPSYEGQITVTYHTEHGGCIDLVRNSYTVFPVILTFLHIVCSLMWFQGTKRDEQVEEGRREDSFTDAWWISFFLKTEQYSTAYAYPIFFFYSPVDALLGCFHAWLLWLVMQWTWGADISPTSRFRFGRIFTQRWSCWITR